MTVTLTDHPYADAALDIADTGIGAPIPLPLGAKYPPPRGVTGRQGIDPDTARIRRWRHWRPQNIAIRLAGHVIGIDVDAADGKPGADTLARLEQIHGPLPDTWTSTARNDGISGIRLYTVEGDTRTMRDPGAGIELIRRHHRYLLAAPSIHPTAGRYRWRTPDGTDTYTAPTVNELPALPDGWVEHLYRQCGCRTAPRNMSEGGALRQAVRRGPVA